jgi:hypothetical protein
MSNHVRRHRHMHNMSTEVAARRKVQRGLVPMVPGVIPDREQASTDQAMLQAHQMLPYISGTQVVIRLYDPEPGLEIVRQAFGDKGVVAISNMLFMARVRGATQPTVVISCRQPIEDQEET